jgi:hypothetical protein
MKGIRGDFVAIRKVGSTVINEKPKTSATNFANWHEFLNQFAKIRVNSRRRNRVS